MADAYLAMASAAALELLVVGLARRSDLLGVTELTSSLRLLPVAWVAVAPLALVAGAMLEALTAAAPSLRGRTGVRPFVVAAIAAGLAVAIEIGGTSKGAAASLEGRWGSAMLALVAFSGSALAAPMVSGRRRLARPVAALCLFAASAAIAPTATQGLGSADNVRAVYADHAPVLGRMVELAVRLAPPPPIEAPTMAPSAPTLDLDGTDILLVTLHDVRADHLGVYGYDRPTSPNLERIAKGGAVFEAAYAPTPDASAALTSLMTGKYMRALAVQGFGADSDTFAECLGRYGYRTAAFYSPAVLAELGGDLAPFRDAAFGFADRRAADLAPVARARSVVEYVGKARAHERLFVWASLDAGAGDGNAKVAPDAARYDAEISRLDEAIGELVDGFLARRPRALVVITSDRGRAFDEHSGRDRGSLVYDEDVRVPLVVIGPGVAPGRPRAAVGVVDLLPTILSGLDIPRPARLRGRDVGARLVAGSASDERGFAFAESDAMTMVAEDAFRLLCLRRAGSCELYNVRRDPGETRDVTGNHPDVVARLRSALVEVESSETRFETRGIHGSTRAWPEALQRGIAGDGEAAAGVAALLADTDLEVRRKAAAVLFELRRPEAAGALKLALARDQDATVRDYASLALTRLGEGSPRTRELLFSSDRSLRRLAALALAENGDDHGANELVSWWRSAYPHDPAEPSTPIEVSRAREIARGFSKARLRPAILPLIDSLRDPRVRPFVAVALADIGDDAARVPLADQLLEDQDPPTRLALVDALLRLKAGAEIVKPLTAVLGLPDPVPRGLEAALKTKMLQHVGGPAEESENTRMKRFATTGVAVDFFVPKVEVDRGVRAICLARSEGEGEIRIGRRLGFPSSNEKQSAIPTEAPPLDPSREVAIKVGGTPEPVQVYATLPPTLDVHPGKPATLVVFATQGVSVEACALVPLRADLQGLRRADD